MNTVKNTTNPSKDETCKIIKKNIENIFLNIDTRAARIGTVGVLPKNKKR